MKVAVLQMLRDIRVQDVTYIAIVDNELLVQVECCGACGQVCICIVWGCSEGWSGQSAMVELWGMN